MSRNTNHQRTLADHNKPSHPIYRLVGLLDLCRSRLDKAEIRRFGSLTVDDVLHGEIDQDLIKKLSRSIEKDPSSKQAVYSTVTSCTLSSKIYSSAVNADLERLHILNDHQIRELEAELAMLHSSVSWRITAPFRTISKILRHWQTLHGSKRVL